MQFKINYNIVDEINALEISANGLNDTYKRVETGVLTELKSIAKYQSQQRRIKKALDKLNTLVIKDATNIREMFNAAEATDESIAVKMSHSVQKSINNNTNSK